MTKPAIHIIDVSKKFDSASNFTLQNINLKINTGEKIGIIGENGAGKSTLLKIISGNILPTTGTICTNGTIECLFDSSVLLDPSLSPYEIASDFLFLKDINNVDLDKAILNIKEFCDIGDRFYDPFYTLSLGMKARVQFAIKTSLNSEIVLIDEVLGAGDTTMAVKSAKRIQKLADTSTFLCVSHSLSHIREFTNRCIWTKDSSLYMDDNTDKVLIEYENFMKNKIDSSLPNNAASRQQKDVISLTQPCFELCLDDLLPKTIIFNHSLDPTTIDTFYLYPEISTKDQAQDLLSQLLLSSTFNNATVYSKLKPYVISLCIKSSHYSLDNVLFGDGEWLLVASVWSEKQTLTIHACNFSIPRTNHADPPLLLIDSSITLDDSVKVDSYLSTQC